MSVRVMSLVWDSTVPAPERFTLLALADRADEDGKCWPSIRTLAQKCCTGESTIRRHLTALVFAEVITVEHRFNTSSLYTISLSKLRELSTPSQSDTPCHIGRGVESGRGAKRSPGKTANRPSRSGTPSQIDTPSQIEQDPPTNLSGPPSQSEHLSISDSSVDPSGDARKRAHRIPDDFAATPEMIAWARKNTPNVGQAETEQFIDYWQSESGAKARKIDWTKAWKVWMRREQKRVEQSGRHLRSVPSPEPLPADSTAAWESFRERSAGPGARKAAEEAASLIRDAFIPTARPRESQLSEPEWIRRLAAQYIDDHAAEIRAALERKAAG